MAAPAWTESSLARSSRLGLQVLERAQKRSVDWRSVSCSGRVRQPEDKRRSDGWDRTQSGNRAVAEHACSQLNNTFDTVMQFMANTTYQCKKFYSSVPAHDPSEYEVNHVCRYHSRNLPAPPRTIYVKNEQKSTPEDFHILVSPGTYKITAAAVDATQQTQLVQIKAGESVHLAFHL
ncbi:A-kinase-interacting protein 1 [Paramormyrops kingsleyae]|uniref:A-kinase interacting protein 1 n=1 Tax=Paramormyrops kingsleyae TaxID=1676925 RepID=A0A3B3T8W0_9TELE|nr:A-kinase-interacting protein 1 [Paramormyrops kingsleyae]